MQFSHLPEALFIEARLSAKFQQITVKYNIGFLRKIYKNTDLFDIFFRSKSFNTILQLKMTVTSNYCLKVFNVIC